ncbi:AMP-binding protein [Pseudomonas sp. A-RE-19]|uniref:AMP-binding protein n=1 Tax=Pseudomonas sp. A-RE-19 TaxID=2832401 RepID=UPI001CBF4C74|nr:AMP-binding protein [Pseudomonas sp. A-RE-19]
MFNDCIRLDQTLVEAAQRYPQRPALQAEDASFSYQQLNEAVNKLCELMRAEGVHAGDRIGIYIAKSAAAVVAIYAALRLGALVAPMDVKDPAERGARMLANADLDFLLATPASQAAASKVVSIHGQSGDARTVGGLWLFPLRGQPLRHAGCEGGYVLFTSGSTGAPKGVCLSHANVLHFCAWAARAVALDCEDRVGSQAALTFDLTTFDLFSTALAGACLCLLPDYLKTFPRDVTRWLGEQSISVFYAVPTLYQMLLQQGGIEQSRPSALRAALYAGEPFPPQLLKRYLTAFPDLPFYNLYGPTETNVCTAEQVSLPSIETVLPSIGWAIDGVEVEIIGDDGRAASEGEIFVAGPTVFAGYLVDGVCRDARRAVYFRDGVERLAYGTGDIGYQAADGRFHLQGRRDHQVKRRGHRIDLLDIESAVLALPGVETAAVVARQGTEPDCEIWVHVVSAGAGRDDIVRGLSEALPKRMRPDGVRMARKLPATANGKIDRRALSMLSVNMEEISNEEH